MEMMLEARDNGTFTDTKAIAKAMDSIIKDGYVDIYEVHGFMNMGDGKNEDYRRVFAYALADGSVLWETDEDKEDFPYKSCSWDAQGWRFGMGVVESGMQAQRWTNDVIIKSHEMLELAAKRVSITNDPNLAGNFITSFENGEVLQVKDDSWIRPIELSNPVFNQATALAEMWQKQYGESESVYASNTGETMPGNTPYRTTAILNNEANSHFDQKREEAGLFWGTVFNEWVIPEMAKRINNKKILEARFTDNELRELDEVFSHTEAFKETIDNYLRDRKMISQEDFDNSVKLYKETQRKLGDRRFLDIPSDFFKDFRPKISISFTNESRNKQVVFESLSNILNAAQNPAVMQDPALSQIFFKLVELSNAGISPTELRESVASAPQSPEAQMQQMESLKQMAGVAQEPTV